MNIGTKRLFNLFFIKNFWFRFKQNYTWIRYIYLYDSWLAKLSIGIPFIGYLILFNDSVTEHLKFEQIGGTANNWNIISAKERLYALYFGLIFLGLANLIYRFRRPPAMKLGKSYSEYVRRQLEQATLLDYVNFHEEIENQGHTTLYGKYHTNEWDGFVDFAKGGVIKNKDKEIAALDWAGARNQYESLLRNILTDAYARRIKQRKISLSICVGFGLLGIILLCIPSVDLFLRVLETLVKDFPF